MNKQFFQPPSKNTGYEPFDQERIEEELTKLLKEIRVKTKEYNMLKNAHNQTEAENLKTIKLIESLITDCQQVENPIEKQNQGSNTSKKKTLMTNLQDQLNGYQNELIQKEEKLKDLKTKNQKILRLFEIENKLAEASEQYTDVTNKYNELVIKLNDLNFEFQKSSEQKDFYIFTNNKLKQENKETKNKIKILEEEINDMTSKEKSLDEKNTEMKNDLNNMKNVLKEKDEEIEKLKKSMEEYNTAVKEKENSDTTLMNQIKQINVLKDQNEKKSRQIKELEKVKENLEKEIEVYKQKEKNVKASSKLVQAQNNKKKKEEELQKAKEENESLKKKLELKKEQMKPAKLSCEKQITFKLNVPLTINGS